MGISWTPNDKNRPLIAIQKIAFGFLVEQKIYIKIKRIEKKKKT